MQLPSPLGLSPQLPQPTAPIILDAVFRNLTVTGTSNVAGVVSLSVVGDGVADDSPAINAALAVAPVGSRIVGVAGKNCAILSPIVVPKSLTLDLTGMTITARAAMTDMIRATDISNVTVVGGIIDQNFLASNGVRYYSTATSPQNLFTYFVTFRNAKQDDTLNFSACGTLATGGASSVNRCQNIRTIACIFEGNIRSNGLMYTYADQCSSFCNWIGGLLKEGIMHIGCKRILVQLNQLSGVQLNAIEIGAQSSYFEVSNNSLTGCSVVQDSAISIESEDSHGSVHHNTLDDCPITGVSVSFNDGTKPFPNDTPRNIQIHSNTIRCRVGTVNTFGIVAYGSSAALANGIKINDNTVDGFNKGIQLLYAQHSEVCRNTITNLTGAGSYAVQLVFTNYSNIESNHCDSVTGDHAYQFIAQVGVPANQPDNAIARNNTVLASGAGASKALVYFEGTGALVAGGNFTGGSSSYVKCNAAAQLQLLPNFGAVTVAEYEGTPVLQSIVYTGRVQAIGYGPAMTFDSTTGNTFVVTPNNAVAFTINAPLKPSTGQTITVRIVNTTGGALGALTWNAVFRVSSSAQPATGFHRDWTFQYDGTNWQEISRSQSDIPN